MKNRNRRGITIIYDTGNGTFIWMCLKSGHEELEMNVKDIWSLPATSGS